MTDAAAGVRLRDVTIADADLLDAWNADEASRSKFNDFGDAPSRAPRDLLRSGPLERQADSSEIYCRLIKRTGLIGYPPGR